MSDDPQIAALFEAGRAAWPDVALEAGDFAGCVQSKLSAGTELAALRGPDLYLACALEQGIDAAVRHLERMISRDLPSVVATAPALRSQAEDLRQSLLERLLVPPESGKPPRISGYSGAGSFQGWVRVSLTRLAVTISMKSPREEDRRDDDALYDLSGPTLDPELEQMKRLYQSDFKELWKEALAALEPRDRNVLRHRYLDGLQVDQIASSYGIHRVTAARQLSKARASLEEHLRERIGQRFGLSSGEADSLVRLMGSRLELSLRGALGTEPSAE